MSEANEKMKKIFERWKDDIHNVREELIRKNNKIADKVDSLHERVKKLERIVKYSKDEPTGRIEFYWGPEYVLYLYIDKEEYIIHIKDLPHGDNPEVKRVSVCGNNIARVNIVTGDIIHCFTIDYVRDAYLYAGKLTSNLVSDDDSV